MKLLALLVAFIVLGSITVFSQDHIFKNNGEKIRCKILNEDSTKIYFMANVNGMNVNTYINKSEVQSVIYNVDKPSFVDQTSFGVGIGMDYGGFGASLLVYPGKSIGLFFGGGYAIAGLGLNAGVKVRFISKDKFRKVIPFLLAMYGYNAAIKVVNADQYNKFFYGPTIGFGFDLKSRPDKKGYWTLAMDIPIRSSEVDAYIEDLKDNHNIEFKNELLPIAFSFGYRFIIK